LREILIARLRKAGGPTCITSLSAATQEAITSLGNTHREIAEDEVLVLQMNGEE
jgi:hypothetical protein